MKIAITADLHWGHGGRGDEATLALREHLRREPPEVLLLGGDIGTADHFQECLELFADLPGERALVPGNHDLWVENPDPRSDSLEVFEHHLPRIASQCGFHYLDHGPLFISGQSLAVVGTVNWYDYSWSLDQLRQESTEWEMRLKAKAFTRGRHNDGRFIRWALDDGRFTHQVVETFHRHLIRALGQVEKVVVLTHHPAMYGLNFPREQPASGWDGLLWDALSGNRRIEQILLEQADRLALICSGHTHRARQNRLGSAPAWNIGGDYHFKRLLVFDWPGGAMETYTFGDPVK